ncbi:hypothetical protein QP027_02180 [Corynebacterium breve]|uniref:Uncharacterized protein n=1 Tax=Corynebacterium breve TaxID=3049799 RepID=A0ABY8VEZ2_9CORY|nr:hypothetical protein [Corynebacterium breve]WIM68231.1 hypothetical protein QP027_02180 [Corynebacterium breve]
MRDNISDYDPFPDSFELLTSEQEEAKQRFRKNRLPYIDSVTLTLHGMPGTSEFGVLSIQDKKVTVEREAEWILDPSYKPPSYITTRQTLGACHSGLWAPTYESDLFIMDGQSWRVRLTFSNGAPPFESRGQNSSPPTFQRLVKLFGFTAD